MNFQMYSLWQYCIAALLLVLATGGRAVADSGEGPLFVHNQRLTPQQLVEAVLARNPTLPAMQAAWQAAQSRIEPAAALDDPLLSYAVAPRTVGADDQDFGQKLELSQQLPWPGKRQLRGERAQHEADAAQQDIETLRLTLSATTRSLFADWYFIHEAIRINRINQDLLQEFRRIAEARYSTGQASKQDALRADVEFNLLKHRAIVLERQRRDSLARINTLLNRAPDERLPLPAKLSEPGPLPSAQTLRSLAVQVRPEFKALTAHIEASRSTIDLARRAFYPDFNLKAGYNSLWNQDEKRFTVGVGINLPLDRSKRRAVEDAARARTMQAQWRLTDEAAVVAGDVQRAYDRVEESHHVLTLYRDRLLPLAEENLAAAKVDYQGGSGDFLSLLTTEKNLMQTQLQVEQAVAELH
ncbi:MAG TPA: TolC family protein, partial [Gammaproteobacteria bacterium]|nr:TolC family protein [Gammaproteobacteria bacterium]